MNFTNILFISFIFFGGVVSRSLVDESLIGEKNAEHPVPASAWQRKQVACEGAPALINEEQWEESGGFDSQSNRKFQTSDSSYSRRDARQVANDEPDPENRMYVQKREIADAAINSKDSSIEVILDSQAKKAVAVVENSPEGQAVYELGGWKGDKESANPESSQEQVVNLVYPAEFESEGYEGNKYAKQDFKEKMETKRASEDVRKLKRNVESMKAVADAGSDKAASSETLSKRKIESESNQVKSDANKDSSNECPPHNSPSASNAATANLENKASSTKESSSWAQDKMNALSSTLSQIKDSNQVQNLKNILTDMGVLLAPSKRETNKDESSLNADMEDEDMAQDNLVMKRNDRVAKSVDEMDSNDAPEAVEKREVDDMEALDEEDPQEFREYDSYGTMRKLSKRELKMKSEFEKKIEAEIQDKIEAIKENLKREIMESEFKHDEEKEHEHDLRRRRSASLTNSDDSLAKSKAESQGKMARRKRSSIARAKQMSYRPYQAEQEQEQEVEDEGEFDDQSYDGRTYVEKRQAEEESDYVDTERKREVDTYLQDYYPEQRSRRASADSSLEGSEVIHGTATSNRRGSVRSSNTLREKRGNGDPYEDDTQLNEDANTVEDNEYFGSLPQSYNGELNRYKRVKKDI